MEAQADLVALNAVDGVDGVFDQVAEHADQHMGGFRIVGFRQQAGFLDGQLNAGFVGAADLADEEARHFRRVNLAQQRADLFLIVAGGIDDVVFQLLVGLHVQHAEYHVQLVHKFVRLHP